MACKPDVTVYGTIAGVDIAWGEYLERCSVATDHPDFPLIEASISFRKGDRKIRVKNGQKARVTMMWWKPPGGRKAKWVVRSWEILTSDEPDSSHVFAPEPEEEVPQEDGVDYHFTKPESLLKKEALPKQGIPAGLQAACSTPLHEETKTDFMEGIKALQPMEGLLERPVPLVSGHVDLKESPPSNSLEDPPADCAFDPPPPAFSQKTVHRVTHHRNIGPPTGMPPNQDDLGPIEEPQQCWLGRLLDRRKKR